MSSAIKRFIFVPLYFYVFCAVFGELLKEEGRTEICEQSVSEIVNEFGCRLLPKLASRDNNLIYSPFSITMALSMVYLGTASTTALELKTVIFGNRTICSNGFHKHWISLFAAMDVNNLQYVNQLNSANGLWFNQKFIQLEEQFKRQMKDYYNAVVHAIDFAQPGNIIKINDWVNFATKGKIKSVVEEDSVNKDTMLLLVNALYFKSLWQEEFLKEDTFNSQFFIDSSRVVVVRMMRKKVVCSIYYDDSLGLQVLKLPYANATFSMFLALPQELDSLSHVVKHATNKQLNTWERSLHETVIDVRIPKFSLTSTNKLEQIMQELGIRKLFDAQKANLSGIFRESQLHVSSIVHKAFIEVNEQGTEASAISEMHIRKRSLGLEFTADHPFIFWIKHVATNTLVFLGQVVVPHFESETIEFIDIRKRHIEL